MKTKIFYIILILSIISCNNKESKKQLKNIEKELVVENSINKSEKTTENKVEFVQNPILEFEHNGESKIGQINDSDGYTNLRLKKNSKSKIISKITDNQYFFYLPKKTENWYKVKDLKGNVGFIHKSRITEVSNKKLYNISYTNYDKKTQNEIRKDSIIEFKDLEKSFENLWEIEFNYKSIPFLSKTTNSITFKENNIQVKFIKEKFNRQTKLNDKVWGTDGGIPRYQYKSIEIIENGQTYNLPKDKISDLFEPTLDKIYIGIFTNINNQMILSLSNSDGAGSYIAVFILEKTKIIKRIVYMPF